MTGNILIADDHLLFRQALAMATLLHRHRHLPSLRQIEIVGTVTQLLEHGEKRSSQKRHLSSSN
jgi:hypothetical protein